MQFIVEAANKTHDQLKGLYDYSENNWQKIFGQFLTKISGGSVQLECTLALTTRSDGDLLFLGFGRIDVLFQHNGETHIIELKVAGKKSGKPGNQVRRYVKHYSETYGPCTGSSIIFSQICNPDTSVVCNSESFQDRMYKNTTQ